jgi:hypothetical protein
MKILVTIILIAFIASTSKSKPHLYVKNNKIYDENGGERIFHGVNLV